MGYRRQAVKVKTSGFGSGNRLLRLFAAARRPFLLWVMPPAVLIGLCFGGLHFSRSYVRSSARYRVTAPVLPLPDPLPSWWEQAFTDEINRSCAFADGMSIVDESLLEQIAGAYLRCPWVRRVRWVERRFPNRVCAAIDLRMPAAAVVQRTRRGITYHLVGADGVRLPKVYHNRLPRGLGVPVIAGVKAGFPTAGERWRQKSVSDALEIVRLLRSNETIRKSLPVATVDVRNYGGRDQPTESEFVVRTRNNCVIHWGRAPDTERPGELPAADKLRKLERFITRGHPTSGRTLSVRFPGRTVVIRRPGANGDSS